jgi:hypothetical protein
MTDWQSEPEWPESREPEEMPYCRWLAFHACENADRTAHILVIDDSGGSLFCDNISDIDQARWAANVLNNALTAARGGSARRRHP